MHPEDIFWLDRREHIFIQNNRKSIHCKNRERNQWSMKNLTSFPVTIYRNSITQAVSGRVPRRRIQTVRIYSKRTTMVIPSVFYNTGRPWGHFSYGHGHLCEACLELLVSGWLRNVFHQCDVIHWMVPRIIQAQVQCVRIFSIFYQ